MGFKYAKIAPHGS